MRAVYARASVSARKKDLTIKTQTPAALSCRQSGLATSSKLAAEGFGLNDGERLGTRPLHLVVVVVGKKE